VTEVNKEEWEASDQKTRPALRLCMTIAMAPVISPDSVADHCEWCNEPVWVAAGQEMPAMVRERGTMKVCANCVLADEEMAVSVFSSLPDVYHHWVKTGVVKPIRFGEDDS
jgi:hypothetical protein